MIYRNIYKEVYRKMSEKNKKLTLEKQKIRKMGNYHYISVPKALMDTGVLSLSKKYDIIISEINQ